MESNLSSPFRRHHRWFAGLLLIAGLSLLAGVFRLKHPAHSLHVRACFQDVSGLRAPAFVRIAGVEVGTVQKVRAQPANSICPAAVEMEIATDYPLSVPSDAIASVNTAGILGPPYVAIDATHASGPPVENGGQIRSQETTPITAAGLERALKEIEKMVNDKSVEPKSDIPRDRDPAATRNSSPKSHSD